MCGIFGCFARRGDLPDGDALIRLTNTLAHRGPDGGGWWSDGPFFLGHRRLAIIDVATGAQPMASVDGRFVVTFNGEIYNHVELRAELVAKGHAFRTASDTEVLLHGWRQWGTELPSRLAGMFAFALVDRSAQTMFVARDRFGEKPLFVLDRGGRVSVASELRALAALLGADASVAPEALADFLCFNYVPGEQTLLAGVERLRPGTWRLYGTSDVRDGAFAESAVSAPAPRNFDDAVAEVRTRLDDAVRIALRSDVPVTLFLSGGIDSSLVAESAARQAGLAEAFCLDFADGAFSEWDKAKLVADRLGLRLNRVLAPRDPSDDFLAVVDHADDPIADASALAVWALARETSRRYKVALSGDGGDELFGGYVTYAATLLHRDVVSRLPRAARALMAAVAARVPVGRGKVTRGYKLRRFLRAAALPTAEAHFTWNGSWMPEQAARLASGEARELALQATARQAARTLVPSAPSLVQLQRADLAQYLANDLLVKVDRMTMAFGLESRAPLLDPRLAELALVATSQHAGNAVTGRPKRLLRALADRRFGRRISAAPKQGFSPPVDAWLRGTGRALLHELLSPASLARIGLLDAAETARLMARFDAGEPLAFELYGLLVLAAWHRARVQRPTSVLERASGDLPQVAVDRIA